MSTYFVADTELGSANYTVLSSVQFSSVPEFRVSCLVCEKMSEYSMTRKTIYEVL